MSAPIVYAGDGWMIKSKGLDPYKNIDVKGKLIAVYSDGPSSGRNIVALPQGVTQADLTGERGKDWADVTTYARANGAAGVLVLPSKFLSDNWGMVSQMFGRSRMVVEKLAPAVPAQAAGAPSVFIASQKLAAAIFAGDASVFTLSLHGARNFPFVKPAGDCDVELTDGAGDAEVLPLIAASLADLARRFTPDLVLYQAGVDALAADKLGRLGMSHAGLAERDRLVLTHFRDRGVPVVLTLGGGYAEPIELTIDAHLATYRAAAGFA